MNQSGNTAAAEEGEEKQRLKHEQGLSISIVANHKKPSGRMGVVGWVIVGLVFIIGVSAILWRNSKLSRAAARTSAEAVSLVESSKGPASSGTNENMETAAPVLGPDARAFVIVKHEKHGYLVLNAYKERKGQHGQIPGGRIDSAEDTVQAAVREFFEETGILVDKSRVKPLWPIANKHFFILTINDSDQVKGGSLPNSGEQFRLKLSDEHVSFSFFKNIHDAARAVLKHSGGTCAEALEKYATSAGL